MAITSVHYELTDLCNAGCPQCPRTDPNGCKPVSWLAHGTCTLSSFRRYSPPDFLRELKSAYFCGNFGDAAVVPELIEIVSYCWEANPRLWLALHTNASLRSPSWWRELAIAARGRPFKVIAGIDGASHETNRRYRVRTDFQRVLENLTAFIAAGGKAEWRMIVFGHNEHEVEAAERMSQELGFVGFRSYPSDRFGGKDSLRYTNGGEEFVLEPPRRRHAPKLPHLRTVAQPHLATDLVIDCDAISGSSAFINFEGYILPCCYVGGHFYIHTHRKLGDNPSKIGELFDRFDMRRLNVDHVGFTAARAAYDEFLDYLRPHWEMRQPQVCKNVCGKRRSGLTPGVAH